LPLLERCAALGVPVVQTYGLTETTSQAATLDPQDALSHLGSAGKPLMTAEIRIDAPSSDGSGEILVRGPIVSPGYVHSTEERREGWLHTGDIGRVDAEGYLYVLDRRSDLIVTGGENVYPAEVEAVLTAHPAVREAGVFPLADSEWGQIVAAAVVPVPGSEPDAAELMAFCRERLAAYKTPRRIVLVETLPRNAAGKLLRSALRMSCTQ
jgi:O-succinylbenzoic acid--CoA ligase